MTDNDPVGAFTDHPPVPVANSPKGPLAGTTFAVKDIFDVAGYVTGCGNPVKRAENPPAEASARVVQTLLDAGAKFAGKVHTAELAFSLDGRNEHYGTPVNPAAPERVPGGSSSGSAAAVAAGLVDFALGSDTGGSVRGPASFCGIIGHRPTQDRIDLTGTMPLAKSFDTPGWFTRDIDLYARVGVVLLGEDVAGPPLSRGRIVTDAFAQLRNDAQRQAFSDALAKVARALASVDEVQVAEDGLTNWQPTFRIIQGYEAWQAHGPWITSRKPKLNPAVQLRFEVSSRVTLSEYEAAKQEREVRRQRVRDVVGDDGVLIIPTMPDIPPRLDSSEDEFEAFRARAIPLMCIAQLSGLPQISLPLVTFEGVPMGLSLIAPAGRDRALIDLAKRVLSA